MKIPIPSQKTKEFIVRLHVLIYHWNMSPLDPLNQWKYPKIIYGFNFKVYILSLI